MRYTPSFSRRYVLLIAIISPALLGSQFKCAAVSNPSLATVRIDQLEPAAPRVGDVVQAIASGSGTPPLQFAWDFGDGGPLAYGGQAAHVYTAPGSYRVTLTVHDARGEVALDSEQVTVLARLPPSMPTLVMVSEAIANQPVEFVALTFEADAEALSYDWTFSDGQSAIGPQTAAIFPVAGVYRASVTVTNAAGEIAVAQAVFKVAEASR
ncbi:PKD domain-containing protein [Peristeroidobacter agariperforans]|uniref:PKD domain-containing protein n=1 Tax=Peristeroidobacter agariperforans TaxID=268404 RepID=UPI0018E52AC1|nr:PKD domain-containing protein [Peristeroidobacter agariperforans]